MGLFNIKSNNGLLDIVRCDEPEFLIWKWHPSGMGNSTKKENAIRWGSSLRVKDGEVAIFVYKQHDGTMQDFIEGPFDQIIKTENFPIISNILGLAYAGKSPFQAEVYFINLAGNIQIKFGVPYFEVYDPRFEDFGVPTAVRGSFTFFITDFKRFIKLNRLINFDLDTFNQQVKNAIIKFIKGVVTNIPFDLNINLVQIERKIFEINDYVYRRLKDSVEDDFGITLKRLDISHIELDKESEQYLKLKGLTADLAERLIKTKADIEIDILKTESDLKKRELDGKAIRKQKIYPILPQRTPCKS